MINPPIYRLTTAVSDIDQTYINRDIRDGNWLSTRRDSLGFKNLVLSHSGTYVLIIFMFRRIWNAEEGKFENGL